jgi:phosphodiesterase/alkaline phosphatase D-like protein
VDVLTATDGQDFKPLVRKTLPEKHEHGPNWMFTVDRELSVRATHLKVVIKSGYRAGHWGLGEIEVFGTGADMLPDDDLYFVNTDLMNLQPGTLYHYRLVAIQNGKTYRGKDLTYRTPGTQQPLCQTGAATRISATSAKVDGRLNPLGEAAQFYFEYGVDADYGQRTAPASAGQQIAPRLVFATLRNLKPATAYHYRLVGTNASGTSYGEDSTFRTATAR